MGGGGGGAGSRRKAQAISSSGKREKRRNLAANYKSFIYESLYLLYESFINLINKIKYLYIFKLFAARARAHRAFLFSRRASRARGSFRARAARLAPPRARPPYLLFLLLFAHIAAPPPPPPRRAPLPAVPFLISFSFCASCSPRAYLPRHIISRAYPYLHLFLAPFAPISFLARISSAISFQAAARAAPLFLMKSSPAKRRRKILKWRRRKAARSGAQRRRNKEENMYSAGTFLAPYLPISADHLMSLYECSMRSCMSL